MFAELLYIGLSCWSNTTISDCKGRHHSDPNQGILGAGAAQGSQRARKPAQLEESLIAEIGGYQTWLPATPLKEALAHRPGILPQHGVQINRDHSYKKGRRRDATETLLFSFLKKPQTNRSQLALVRMKAQ